MIQKTPTLNIALRFSTYNRRIIIIKEDITIFCYYDCAFDFYALRIDYNDQLEQFEKSYEEVLQRITSYKTKERLLKALDQLVTDEQMQLACKQMLLVTNMYSHLIR